MMFRKNGFQIRYFHSTCRSNFVLPIVTQVNNSTFERVKRRMDIIGELLQIKSLEDWYKIPNMVIQKKGKGAYTKLLQNYGSLVGILQIAYPNKKWYPWLF